MRFSTFAIVYTLTLLILLSWFGRIIAIEKRDSYNKGLKVGNSEGYTDAYQSLANMVRKGNVVLNPDCK